jgi:tetratricopeptide (TPR) repeat protein
MQRASTAVLCGLAAALAPAAQVVDGEAILAAHRFTRTATAALLRGDVEQAETFLERAFREVADFPAARLAAGHVALARDRFDTALEEYLRAKRGYAALGDALFEVETERHADARESIAGLRKEIERVTEKFRKSDAASDEAPALRSEVRSLKLRVRQLEIVQPPVRGGAAIPAEVDYHVGNALFLMQELAGAVEAWRACTAKQPAFALAHNNLAVALADLGRKEEARACLEEAERLGLTIDPRLEERVYGSRR